jgi:hypothetical protein
MYLTLPIHLHGEIRLFSPSNSDPDERHILHENWHVEARLVLLFDNSSSTGASTGTFASVKCVLLITFIGLFGDGLSSGGRLLSRSKN